MGCRKVFHTYIRRPPSYLLPPRPSLLALAPHLPPSRTPLSSPDLFTKYVRPILPQQYTPTLTKSYLPLLWAPLSKCLSSPLTVRQSELRSQSKITGSSLAPKSLTDFPPKAIPALQSGHSPAAARRGLQGEAAAASSSCQLAQSQELSSLTSLSRISTSG